MDASGTITEADILSEQVGLGDEPLPREAAQALLKLAFRPTAIDRINELAERNREGLLTADEQAEFEKYLRVGMFLNIVQAKARVALSGEAPPN